MNRKRIRNFYTVKELAALLVVQPITIYRMVDRGQFPAIRIGKSLRFDPADIETFLDRIRINPPPPPEEPPVDIDVSILNPTRTRSFGP